MDPRIWEGSMAPKRTGKRVTTPSYSQAQLESLAGMLKPTVHIHAGDRCKAGTHHPACGTHGPEIVCVGVRIFGHQLSVCVHL